MNAALSQLRSARPLIIATFFVAQAVLLVGGFFTIRDVHQEVEFTHAEVDALVPAQRTLNTLINLGEFRGSCSATAHNYFFGLPKLERLCRESLESLESLDYAGGAELFEQVSRLISELQADLSQRHASSNVLLDPVLETNGLGYLIFETYPRLVELLGQVRGERAMRASAGTAVFENNYDRSQRAALLRSIGDLLSNPNLPPAKSAMTSVFLTSVRAYLINLPAIPIGETDAVQAEWDEITGLIESLAAAAAADTESATQLLQARLAWQTTQRNALIGLFFMLSLLVYIGHWLMVAAQYRQDKALADTRQARHELTDLLAKQKHMFAVVGHELRTPVSLINMMSENRERIAEDLLDDIGSTSEQLLAVLEDLRFVVAPERALEVAKNTAVPTNLIERAVGPLMPLASDKGIALTISVPEQTEAFEMHDQALRQVINNLVNNAIKHSRGSQISVQFDYQWQSIDHATAVLRVEDNGIGVPETARDSVFEPFVKGVSGHSDGTGLGLSIVRQFSELMQGQLAYFDSDLGGAGFELTFPIQAAELELQKTKVAIDALSGLRILFAEDDSMLRIMTQRILEKRGAQVTAVEDGQKALNAYDPNEFDLVLTDLMMPNLDGLGLVKAVREQGGTTPIVAVTAAVIGNETQQLLSAGANHVIPKPIKPDELADWWVENYESGELSAAIRD